MTSAQNAAHQEASQAGYTGCAVEDSNVDYETEIKMYLATVTVAGAP